MSAAGNSSGRSLPADDADSHPNIFDPCGSWRPLLAYVDATAWLDRHAGPPKPHQSPLPAVCTRRGSVSSICKEMAGAAPTKNCQLKNGSRDMT
ncbi:MAG: hypothetical protein EBZ36_15010 [Acidobacteria bacterium]|nr:hypothetical protein [Acidobacteriota bacterium]